MAMSVRPLNTIGLFFIVSVAIGCGGNNVAPASTASSTTVSTTTASTTTTTVVPPTTAGPTTTTTAETNALKLHYAVASGCEAPYTVYVYGLESQTLERPITADLWIGSDRFKDAAVFIEDRTLASHPTAANIFEGVGFEAVGYFEIQVGQIVDDDFRPGRYSVMLQVESGGNKASTSRASMDLETCAS